MAAIQFDSLLYQINSCWSSLTLDHEFVISREADATSFEGQLILVVF